MGDVARAVRQFEHGGRFQEAVPFGNGHIHETFLVRLQGGAPRLILQKINRRVFPHVFSLMSNLQRVTEHLRRKLAEEGEGELERKVLRVIPARGGDLYWEDEEGEAWRAFLFIENTVTLERVGSPRTAFEAARAFGNFQRLLADLPPPPLVEVLPGFHDSWQRYRTLQATWEEDPLGRSAQVEDELRQLQEEEALLRGFRRLQELDPWPRQAVHNDTKVNNLLLDRTSRRALCVIDLDTVMPGWPPWDFADLVRTCISPTAEDTRRLDRIGIRLEIFRALCRGYRCGVGESLPPDQASSLVFFSRLITLETAIRFLTDYLAGDCYFKTRRREQNLDRFRAQFQLYQQLSQRAEELEGIRQKVWEEGA